MALAGVLVFAFLLRLAWVVFTENALAKGHFQYDMSWYWIAGHSLASGRGYVLWDGTPTAVWPPGYPSFLALVILFSKNTLLAVQVVQALLGTFTCFLTYLLGNRLFGFGRGLLGAAVLAACPDHVMFSSLIMSEVLFATLFISIVLVIVVGEMQGSGTGWRRCVAVGAFVGAACLVRGTALLFPSAMFVVWLISLRSLPKALWNVFLVGVGMFCVLGPWAVRNYVQMGHPVLLSTQAGEVLGITHSPHATGGMHIWHWEADHERANEHLEKSRKYRMIFDHLSGPERDVQQMKAETRRALEYALNHPRRELALFFSRIAFLYEHGHAGMVWGRSRAPGSSEFIPIFNPVWDRVLRHVADGYFFAMLGLGLVGACWTAGRCHRSALLLPLSIAYITLLHSILFFGDVRFHFPLLPIFSILAVLPPLAGFGYLQRIQRRNP